MYICTVCTYTNTLFRHIYIYMQIDIYIYIWYPPPLKDLPNSMLCQILLATFTPIVHDAQTGQIFGGVICPESSESFWNHVSFGESALNHRNHFGIMFDSGNLP